MGAVQLKTAPSFYLLGRGKNPTTVRWSMKDRLLTLAVSQLESEKCPHCGIPAWHGQTSHGDVEFAVDWRVCYGCQTKAEQTKNVEAKPGEWAIVKAVPLEEGFELPSRAEGYKLIAVPLHMGGDSAPKPDGTRSIND